MKLVSMFLLRAKVYWRIFLKYTNFRERNHNNWLLLYLFRTFPLVSSKKFYNFAIETNRNKAMM